MFWIEFRSHGTTTLFETDSVTNAREVLLNSVAPGATLIDFSGELDGVLDGILAGVKLFPADEPVKVA